MKGNMKGVREANEREIMGQLLDGDGYLTIFRICLQTNVLSADAKPNVQGVWKRGDEAGKSERSNWGRS